MSAAVQMSAAWSTGTCANWETADRVNRKPIEAEETRDEDASRREDALAFYRKHTEKTLKRYLCASLLVGRAPSILNNPVARGWASSRPIRSFEDAVIFVLDIERCLNRLDALDRQILSRVVLQDYTQSEAACMLGMSMRTMGNRYPQAVDRLTRALLDAELLLLPE